MWWKTNTRIYNLISVPQITQLLLGDAINPSKTDPHNGSKKERRSYGKIESNKTMLKILPFIQILCLKQQNSILQCFSRLEFEKRLFSNTFFSFVFRIIVIMQNIGNFIGWNSVHIFDIFNYYLANINGMWNAKKLSGIYKTFEFPLTQNIHL